VATARSTPSRHSYRAAGWSCPFERSTVIPESGSADGQTLPVYASDDGGDSWQQISEVAAPAHLSNDPEYDPYVSNWTNPNLYALPENVGNLAAGTLLLASVVSGDDYFYLENKAEDPDWVPDNDGDRSDMAIALFSSVDEGETWSVVDIIATGGWQGGSAGASGVNVADANTYEQVDPLWEPRRTRGRRSSSTGRGTVSARSGVLRLSTSQGTTLPGTAGPRSAAAVQA
jgi:hypothetical protein